MKPTKKELAAIKHSYENYWKNVKWVKGNTIKNYSIISLKEQLFKILFYFNSNNQLKLDYNNIIKADIFIDIN